MIRSGITLVAAGLLLSVAYANSDLIPRPVTTFDGRSWSGIDVDVDKDADIKKKFRTTRGAVVPEALLVVSADDTIRVDALLDGRGANAVVRAIRVKYEGRRPTLRDFERELDERPVHYFPRVRHEPWHIAAFEKEGILALVMGDRAVPDRIESVLLMNPERIAAVLRRYDTNITPVTDVIDPGERWDRVLEYGRIDAAIRISANNRPGELDRGTINRIERDAEDDMRYSRGGGSIRYERNARGSYNISVSDDGFGDNGEAGFRVTATIQGETPYGSISESAFSFRKFRDDYRRRIMDLIREVQRDVENKVRDKIRSLAPPPIETLRLEAEQQLWKDATGRR